MPLSFRTALLFILLLTVLATPALARMVIGVTPAITPGVGDPSVRSTLEGELSSRLGETVLVRSFDSEADELDWLIRFRELDAALVGHSLAQTLPAGTLVHLADLHSTVAVTHPGIAAGQQETLRQAFRSLLEDERGRQLLNRLASSAKVASTRRAAQPAASAAPKPEVAAPAAAKPLETAAVELPAPEPAPVPISQPAALPATATAPVLQPATASPPAKTSLEHPDATSIPAKLKPAAADPSVEPAGRKRPALILIAALVIMIGISMKVTLLVRHWQQGKMRPATPPEPPSAGSFVYQDSQAHPVPRQPADSPPDDIGFPAQDSLVDSARTEPAAVHDEVPVPLPPRVKKPAPSTATETDKRPAAKRKTTSARSTESTFPPADDLVVEQGRLGKVKVPALFKRCAELPQPVVLRVRAGDNETSVHFAAGQICHASSRNWRISDGPRQWSKLGYLMVRDGLVSESQRDQALELTERQPGLRFSAALQQLGILDLESLRHILVRQAKATIYSLILFSSGEYRIEADNGIIPAEESIALQVEALIREASHHQSEWIAIRKTLPNLGTQLDFAPDGREKLEQVRLSVHQQLLLSQVDGQTQIGALCCDSTMMDYEACRFLYLMVKAGVLQVVPTP